MTAFPAPNSSCTSGLRGGLWLRAGLRSLGSLLQADADRGEFLHDLGIHGDSISAAKDVGAKISEGFDAYLRLLRVLSIFTRAIQDRVFVLDPTAGGGAFHSKPCGWAQDIANDLNPVAALLSEGDCRIPLRFGSAARRYETTRGRIQVETGTLGSVFPRPAERIDR